jgi:hypothetical protein
MPVIDVVFVNWTERVRGEYLEMPGLALTKWQMRRMWHFDATVCDAVVDALVTSGFLKQRPDRAFVRRAEYF